MAQQKAKVRVKLDTSQAKAQLQGLAKEGEATAGRISDKLSKGSSISGNFSRGAALGAGLAAGAGAVKSIGSTLMGGVGEVFSERVSGAVADLEGISGAPGERGNKRAREETQALFGASVGQAGQLTDASNYFKSVSKLRQREEIGKNRIQSAIGGANKDNSDEAKGLAAGIIDPVVVAVREGFDGIVQLLGGSGGSK